MTMAGKPYKVGLRTVRYEDATRRNGQGTGPRPLLTDIWYPAAPDASEAPVRIGPPDAALFVAGEAAWDADLLGGSQRFPLIALSHGTGGSALGLGWLASALAAHGCIVAGVNHHGNTALEPYTADGFARVWERPRDITTLFDRLLGDPTFGPRIDPERIGAAGFSLGGYTAIALAGGVLDLPHLLADYDASGRYLAADMPPEFADPRALADRLVQLTREATDHKRSYRDERIRAAFVLAPALGEAFTADGLAPVRVPVQIVVGEADTSAPATSNALWFARHIDSADVVLLEGQVGHYTFLAECTEFGCEALPSLCVDNPGVDRHAVHEQVCDMAARFFAQHLGLV
jgi:predicted dienelactone hydrolase